MAVSCLFSLGFLASVGSLEVPNDESLEARLNLMYLTNIPRQEYTLQSLMKFGSVF